MLKGNKISVFLVVYKNKGIAHSVDKYNGTYHNFDIDKLINGYTYYIDLLINKNFVYYLLNILNAYRTASS